MSFSLNSYSQGIESDGYARYTDWNIPSLARKVFNDSGLYNKYEFTYHLNPFYLRGDFNGDSKPDIAILIKETKTKKIGILVIHSDSRHFFILGAGSKIGNGGDDFRWLGVWTIRTNIEEKNQKGEGIYVEKPESAGGLIYWTGDQYVWRQRGD